ncbi:MAG: ATP-dependent RecD-like DNA helicase [Clostridia bacterium]|nr:ATP-dependent RecD-like DNA helicase [Clostridia bacterium]
MYEEFDFYDQSDPNAEADGSVTISGDIASVVYTNEENGYSVVEVELAEGGVITVVGTLPYPGEGESIIAEGSYVTHAVYGSQFKCEHIERMLPCEAGAIMRYLGSGAIKGIGPVTARKIVTKFGIETFDVIENRPEELLAIKGMTQARAEAISAELRTKIAICELMMFFSEYAIDISVAVSVYKRYGNNSREFITENPYRLVLEPYYVDFRQIDRMAQSFGFAADSLERIQAGIAFELAFNQNEGHVCLPSDRLVEVTAQFLTIGTDEVRDAMALMETERTVISESVAGVKMCYLREIHEAEESAARRLVFMASRRYEAPRGAERALDELESEFSIAFSEKQREAVLAAVTESVLVLTGGPGTGKTTAVRGMLGLLDRMNSKTLLAAPTGRAAKRLSELCGREAKTIHRLLEVVYAENGLKFARNEENPLDADTVILDEVSMIDLPLLSSLLSALKHSCRLILVGDPDQLPSVGPGTCLADIIRSGLVRSVHLDEIFRQAQESDIIMNAHAVNRGEMPRLTQNKKDFFFLNRRTSDEVIATVADLCTRRLPKNMGIPPEEIQVLSPSRQYGEGVIHLNEVLRDLINPADGKKAERPFGSVTFREGDRVMQIRNNYDLEWKRRADSFDAVEGQGVFNGDIGVIRRIDLHAQTVTVEFDDKACDYAFDMLGDLEHAYAITVHKAQGSEFRAVVFVASLVRSRLLNRNLFYTAMTRAKELLIIVGNPESIGTMVENKRRLKRYSGFLARLVAYRDGNELC